MHNPNNKGGQPWTPAVVAIYRTEVGAGACGVAPEGPVFASVENSNEEETL